MHIRLYRMEKNNQIIFDIAYAPKEWMDNLDFQLAIARQKLYETTPRTFSQLNTFGQEKRKAYTAIEQLESASTKL